VLAAQSSPKVAMPRLLLVSNRLPVTVRADHSEAVVTRIDGWTRRRAPRAPRALGRGHRMPPASGSQPHSGASCPASPGYETLSAFHTSTPSQMWARTKQGDLRLRVSSTLERAMVMV
jgi:hypothetical protein